MTRERVETVVVGGGQSGLAVGYHLRQRGLPFVILDANERVGDAWRKRWDSLRLFTPARYDALPGMRFPAPAFHYPAKDEVASYLESYARAFELPVRTGVRVERLSKVDHSFEVVWGDHTLRASNVVVATGAYDNPWIPPFAAELDAGVVQLHSKEYRSPSQLLEGDVLVVGAGNSGAEIALELSRSHRTWLSGRDTGQEPTRAGTLADRLIVPVMWFMATRVLTVDMPLGRRVRDHFHGDTPRGIPLARVRRKDLAAAGVERVPRVTGVRRGAPRFGDGTVCDVANVVWCTGFRPDYDWIEVPLPTRHGLPIHDRGVVESCPGLYFMGLPFLYSLSSALLGGVGRDAEHVVEHVAS